MRGYLLRTSKNSIAFHTVMSRDFSVAQCRDPVHESLHVAAKLVWAPGIRGVPITSGRATGGEAILRLAIQQRYGSRS